MSLNTTLVAILQRSVMVIATVVRVLLGVMLIVGGLFWLGRADPGAYLYKNVSQMVEAHRSVEIYASFLSSVVLPNASIFALLVGLGEFLSGLSVALGIAARLGAAVAVFQLLNYGLMGGWVSVFLHGIFAGLIIFGVGFSSRTTGIDRWLNRRWPKPVIW